MNKDDNHLNPKDHEIDRIIDQFNNTKKSPYVFLILLTLPFIIYLLPTNYIESQHMWITILIMLFINSQADIYVLNKKLKILLEIIKKD